MKYINLGDICNIKSSKRIYQSEYCEDGVPFYRGKEISQLQRNEELEVELYISKERYEEIKKKYGAINKGDLLITSVGTIGNTWVSDGREFYYKDGNITQIENNSNINTKFLSYLFKSDIIKNQYLKGTSGTAQIALTIEKLNKIKIPDIDLSEQNRIVEILVKAQELMYKRKEQIEALDELVKSKFIEMFGEYFSDGYLKELDNISNKITDGEHGTVPRVEKGVPYLMARNISVNNSLDFKEVSYIEKEVHEKIYSRCNPEYGDLLIVCVGATIGKVALVPEMEQFSMARSVALVKYDRTVIIGSYLLWLFNHNYMKSQMKNSSNESAQAGLYISKIKKLKVPVPPIELQNQFADFVKQVDKLKSEMEKSLKKLEDNFNSLMQRAFKGELF